MVLGCHHHDFNHVRLGNIWYARAIVITYQLVGKGVSPLFLNKLINRKRAPAIIDTAVLLASLLMLRILLLLQVQGAGKAVFAPEPATDGPFAHASLFPFRLKAYCDMAAGLGWLVGSLSRVALLCVLTDTWPPFLSYFSRRTTGA